jgi:hypothetical protein
VSVNIRDLVRRWLGIDELATIKHNESLAIVLSSNDAKLVEEIRNLRIGLEAAHAFDRQRPTPIVMDWEMEQYMAMQTAEKKKEN